MQPPRRTVSVAGSRVAVRLTVRSTSAEIVAAIEADKPAFVQVRPMLAVVAELAPCVVLVHTWTCQGAACSSTVCWDHCRGSTSSRDGCAHQNGCVAFNIPRTMLCARA